MDKYIEDGGAGDWGTDKARAKLQQDSPGQKIKRKEKMKRFRDILEGVDEEVKEGTLPPGLQAYQDKKNGKKPKDDEKEVEEAMSPADKAKRLKMIKQAVEKMNKSNMERAKKDALQMMKDSGMFDEELEEISSTPMRDKFGPVNPKLKDKNAPKMKKIGFYGSEIGGLRQGNKYYSAKPVEVKGKVGFRVADEFGSFETIDLKTFAKRFG